MWHAKQSMCWQSEEFQANDPTEKVCQKGWHMIFKLVVRKELGTDTMHTSQKIVGHECDFHFRLNSWHVLLFSGFLNCSW